MSFFKFFVSSSFLNKGSKGLEVLSCEFFNISILLANWSGVIASVPIESSAAPLATKRCASSGTIFHHLLNARFL